MAADSVIRTSPSIISGTVPSGLIARYSRARKRGGNGRISRRYGTPTSSSAQSARNERASTQCQRVIIARFVPLCVLRGEFFYHKGQKGSRSQSTKRLRPCLRRTTLKF